MAAKRKARPVKPVRVLDTRAPERARQREANLHARILEMRGRLEQDLVVIEGQVEALIEGGQSPHEDQEANFLVGHAQTIRYVLEMPAREWEQATSGMPFTPEDF